MESAEIGALLDEALQLCQAGALTQAEQIYRQVLAADAAVPDAWNMLALVLYQRGELAAAAEAAERATLLRPQIPPYWLTRGNIAQARHGTREAQSCFNRAIELDPGFAEAHFRLALSYDREERIPDAIMTYRNALRYAPDVAEIHYQLAEALMVEARWVEAMHAYEAAFTRDQNAELDRRGCINCMNYLQFESVPEFWHTEITRFFARNDIDHIHYAKVVLRIFMTKGAFRAVLDAAQRPDARFEPDASALGAVMRDELLRILLRDALVIDAGLELVLTRLRAALLLDAELRAQAPPDFLCALALQCFNNEFIFAESQAESAAADRLLREVDAELQPDRNLPDTLLRPLAVLAMYRPLHAVRGADRLAARRPGPAALGQLLRSSVLNVLTERTLRQDITVIGAITDDVSRAVRDMYEEHPYPRWFSLDRWPPLAFADWLGSRVPIPNAPAEFPAAPRILVAGCGTGKDPICFATDIAGAQVLGVDLSLSSLAYAQRMANELGLTNIEFRQGNILDLGVLTERFDMICATGVLHHLHDPVDGLRVLLQLLRPGGLLKIGLYSERARASVNAARAMIRQQQLPATAAAIREFRQQVFDLQQDTPVRPLLNFSDFYSMSMCRDLLFHVQEHQFQLPQIAAILHDHGLTVLGLSDLLPHAVTAYRQMFPGDDGMNNFAHWDAFEARHPETFAGMYHIWCCVPKHAAA